MWFSESNPEENKFHYKGKKFVCQIIIWSFLSYVRRFIKNIEYEFEARHLLKKFVESDHRALAIVYLFREQNRVLKYLHEHFPSDEVTLGINTFDKGVVAEYHDDISTPSSIFISIGNGYMMKEMLFYVYGSEAAEVIRLCCEKSPRNGHLRNILGAVEDENLFMVLVHEITHHFDPKTRKLLEITSGFRQHPQGELILIFQNLLQIRREGLAEFSSHVRLKSFRFMSFNIKEIYSKMQLDNSWVAPREFYDLGHQMIFIIGLGLLRKADINTYKKIRVEASGSVFLWEQFVENFIEKYDSWTMDNLPKVISATVINKLINGGIHKDFLGAYGVACKHIRIPKKFRLLTLKRYKKWRKLAYIQWEKRVRKAGFVPS